MKEQSENNNQNNKGTVIINYGTIIMSSPPDPNKGVETQTPKPKSKLKLATILSFLKNLVLLGQFYQKTKS